MSARVSTAARGPRMAELVSLPNVPLPIQEILYRIFRPDDENDRVSAKSLLSTTFIAEARLDADHEDRLYIHKDQTKKLKKRLVYSAKEPKARKERGCGPSPRLVLHAAHLG